MLHLPAIHQQKHAAGTTGQSPDSVSPLQTLLYQQLYLRSDDPFEKTPAALIKDESDEEEDEEGEESRQSTPAQKRRGRTLSECVRENREALATQEFLEKQRRRKLGESANAHILWMRARDTRAEILDVKEGDELLARKAHLASVEHRPVKRSASVPTVNPHMCWFRVRLPRPAGSVFQEDLHTTGLAAGGPPHARKPPQRTEMGALTRAVRGAEWQQPEPSAGAWCWRGDFVAEARDAAIAGGMKHAFITKYASGTGMLSHKGYAEVACSTGGMEMWSPSFVGLLEALRARWNLTRPAQEVRKSESEVRAKQPNLQFPERWKPPAPDVGMTLKIPRSLRSRLAAAEPPAPPPLPARLPHTVSYEQDEPWMQVLAPAPLVTNAAATAHSSQWARLPLREHDVDMGYQRSGLPRRLSGTSSQFSGRSYGRIQTEPEDGTQTYDYRYEDDDDSDEGHDPPQRQPAPEEWQPPVGW